MPINPPNRPAPRSLLPAPYPPGGPGASSVPRSPPPGNPHAPAHVPQAPAPCLRRVPSLGSLFLDHLSQDPGAAIRQGALPTLPTAAFVMPGPTAQAARRFLNEMAFDDPFHERRKAGEYAQSYRMEGGQARPNAPIRYEAGDSVGLPPNPPGTFLNIHSHPYVDPPRYNDFPSPQDQRSARDARKTHGQAHELLYHPQTDTFYAYSGQLPLRYDQAILPPPGNGKGRLPVLEPPLNPGPGPSSVPPRPGAGPAGPPSVPPWSGNVRVT